MDARFLAFVGLSALLTVTPGADMALVTRSALTWGRRTAYVTSAGIVSGLLVHATASAVGISAVLRTSAAAFTVVKLAGAVYLVALGLASLRAATRSRPDVAPTEAPTEPGLRAAFAQGLLSNLLNPKVAVFYLAVLPQYVSAGDHVVARSLALAAVHAGLGLLWLVTYAWLVDRLRGALTRPRVRVALEGATGVALVAFGARLAVAARR